MKITKRQLRRIISEAMGNEPQIGDRYSTVRQTKSPGSYSPYRQAEVVGFGRGPLGKTVIVKSLVDPSASKFDIPMPAFKKQFRKIIKEQIATVNKEEIKDVVMDTLSDEGGAAGLDPIEDALEDLETDDINLPDEPIEDVIGNVSGVKRHADGDYIDTTKLESRLRRIVREQLSLEDAIEEILPVDDYHDSDNGRDLGYGEGEGRMTKSQLDKLARYSQSLHDQLMDGDDLPEWVQSKVAVAAENIGKVYHYLDYKMKRMEQESDT